MVVGDLRVVRGCKLFLRFVRGVYWLAEGWTSGGVRFSIIQFAALGG